MWPPRLIEMVAFYPATILVTIGYFAVIYFSRRRPRRGLVRATLSPHDATYFVPVYLWGIESVAHAHWWSFDVTFRGIAPNLLLIGTEQGVYSLVVLGVTMVSCVAAEWCASRAGMRTRTTHGSLPWPVVAGVSSVGLAWCCLLLLWIWAFSTVSSRR